MSEIKTAEERISLLGRAAGQASVDKWRAAHKGEATELRAAYEVLQKENERLKEKEEMIIDILDLLKINHENWFNLYSYVAEQTERIAHLECKIDELMLEYCPDEMTPEQLENWGLHQRSAPEETEQEIDKILEGAFDGGRITQVIRKHAADLECEIETLRKQADFYKKNFETYSSSTKIELIELRRKFDELVKSASKNGE